MKSLVLPVLLAFAPVSALACGPVEFPPPSEAAAPAVADGAVATAVPAADPVAAVEPVPATGPVPGDETVAITAGDADPDRRCVRETGTRIAARDEDGCTGAPGESWDRDDIDRSGAIDTADALRKMSPNATIHR